MPFEPVRSPARPRVLRVSELNRAVRLSLEDRFGDVWVEGEITQAKRAPSGHLYFNLSDERDPAQVSCVMFRSDAARTRATIRDGERVRVRGQLTLYEPRGNYQLMVRIAVPAGDGELRARFELLRRKLASEGLLDPQRKRPLPRLPRTVGVVTSGSSAAYQDVLRVAGERCPVRIVLSDCRVQGAEAPGSIVRALARVQAEPDVDVVILTRGGGSAEDLWSFNDERVVRAVAACRVPIVVGVGHETDVTLAELVADQRAATPSNAAELVVPARDALLAEVDGWQRRLMRALEARLDRERLKLERAERRLRDPRSALGHAERTLAAYHRRLEDAARRPLAARQRALAELTARLAPHDPRRALERQRRDFEALEAELQRLMTAKITQERRALDLQRAALGPAVKRVLGDSQHTLAQHVTALDALSPLRVLSRGYAIAQREDGRALRDADDVSVGDRISVRVARARLEAEVRAVLRDDPDAPLPERETP
ncbi:MAG: exodeoxyribonuclease VII large subunit [Myxococcales bacterium]|nr:exodeoxyribonuclease VII large subunit [Myxococcales bacterium]